MLCNIPLSMEHFYPRPPRGGRPHEKPRQSTLAAISIHALREEGDQSLHPFVVHCVYFYPRPPRGGRPAARILSVSCVGFLSTPSARRATGPSRSFLPGCRYFYPRPPRGGRPGIRHYVTSADGFLSTPSARRATERPHLHCRPQVISIHALREEGDQMRRCPLPDSSDFYPRPPRGGRPARAACHKSSVRFLSTPSARRATRRTRRPAQPRRISIHALREEGDAAQRSGLKSLLNISIHALREEGDCTRGGS